jgi:hypothetical protein
MCSQSSMKLIISITFSDAADLPIGFVMEHQFVFNLKNYSMCCLLKIETVKSGACYKGSRLNVSRIANLAIVVAVVACNRNWPI